MGKKKKRRRGRRKIALAATAGVVGALLPIVGTAMSGNLQAAGQQLVQGFTTPAGIQTTVIPIIMGAMISMAASKLGINRYLSSIPLVKL